MLTFLIFILILSVLVLIHEFGHFYAAKKAGVKVEEFGFGLPPRIFGKKIGETVYSLNLLPFGGFVKLLGEDQDGTQEMQTALKDPNSFVSKSAFSRTMIIIAGVLMNLFLGVFLYYVFFGIYGFKSFNLPLFYDYNFRFGDVNVVNTTIMGTLQDSPAQKAEIQPGEAILEVSGSPVYNLFDIQSQLADKSGQEVKILLMDLRSENKDLRTVSVVPQAIDGKGIIGVQIGESVQIDYTRFKWVAGFMHAYNVLGYSKHGLTNLISDSYSQRTIQPVSENVTGPVGIFSVVGGILDYGKSFDDQKVRLQMSILGLIDLTALLSLSLAFVNILPFPALDGGRLLFILVEKIRGKKVSPSFEVAVHRIGMLILLLLIVLVTIKDISRII